MSDHLHHTHSAALPAPCTRPWRRVLGIGLAALLFLALGAWSALPWIARQVAVPRLAQSLGLADIKIDVRAVRLGGLDIGPAILAPGFSVQAVQVDWSFPGLLRGRVDRVGLFGLDAQVTQNATGWSIAGLPLSAENTSHGSGPVLFPGIDTVTVDGHIRIARQDHQLVLPFWAEGGWRDETSMRARVLLQSPYGSVTLSAPRLVLTAEPFALAGDWSVEAGILPQAARLAGTTQVVRTALGWEAQAQATLDAVDIRLPDGQTGQMGPSALELSVQEAATDAQLSAVARLGDLTLSNGQGVMHLDGLVATMNATRDAETGGVGVVAVAEGRLRASVSGMELASTRIQVHSGFTWGKQVQVQATLTADVQATSGDMTASAAIRLPLAWPEPSTTSGALDVRAHWKKVDIGSVSARLVQKRTSVVVEGQARVLPVDLVGTVRGELMASLPTTSWLEFRADQEITVPGNIATLIPAAYSLSGRARARVTARVHMPRGMVEIPVQCAVRDAQLDHGASGLELRGGFVSLDFADVLSRRSMPDQEFGFSRVQLGKIVLEKADIRYQLEAPQSILVESGALTWAGGRVGTQAFRINPAIDDYTVELYCDRIELAKALEQLGMRQAQGGGRANGRIPVRYAQGKLTFADGFLYSTPGESGVLHIPGTEILTAGIPPDSPQFAQLDLAAEALKDFTYQWAKIRLHTENRELVVALELDGKPSQALPFVYNHDRGGFFRVSAASPGSVFQGIRLDVNFRLPLDELMQYRQLLELLKNGG